MIRVYYLDTPVGLAKGQGTNKTTPDIPISPYIRYNTIVFYFKSIWAFSFKIFNFLKHLPIFLLPICYQIWLFGYWHLGIFMIWGYGIWQKWLRVLRYMGSILHYPPLHSTSITNPIIISKILFQINDSEIGLISPIFDSEGV